jgi:aspartyl protease family protein
MLSSHPTIWLTACATALLGYLNVTGGNPATAATAFAAQAGPQTPPSAVTDLQSAQTVKISKSRDGLFYVTARINDTPVLFLVDTGANLVVLTARDAKRVGIANSTAAASSGAPGRIDTAAGVSMMDRVMLHDIEVANLRASNIDAAVAHGDLEVSLLGQNMLSKLGVITISGDEISISAGS